MLSHHISEDERRCLGFSWCPRDRSLRVDVVERKSALSDRILQVAVAQPCLDFAERHRRHVADSLTTPTIRKGVLVSGARLLPCVEPEHHLVLVKSICVSVNL